MNARLIVPVALAGSLAVFVLAATPHEPDSGRAEATTVVPAGGDPLSDYAKRVRVAPAASHANLALFPISVSGVKVPDVDLPVDKALNAGLVEVTELERSQVSQLRLNNRAKEPVFVMAGEMLRGGKQDRIIGDDLIVPARKEVTVPVFCVERGRWSARGRGGAGFSAGHSLAGAGVRGAGRAGGQGAIWSGVAAQQERLGAPSETGALRSVHDSETVRERMKPYLQALSGLAEDHPTASGIVCAIDGKIAVADLLSSRALFCELWPQLLEAYVIDALERECDAEPSGGNPARNRAVGADDVGSWLKSAASATRRPKKTPGDGDLFEVEGPALVGTALIYDGGVVHLALFGTEARDPVRYNRLRFRRDRLGAQ